MPEKRFLIIQTSFIGDVILATALVEKIHQQFPAASIDFLLRKGNESLFRKHPYLNEVIVWDKGQQKYRNLFRLISKIRKSRYDYVINLQRFLATGLVTALSKGKHTIGFDKNPLSFTFRRRIRHEIGNGMHEVERNFRLISHLTEGSSVNPRLYPAEEDLEKVARLKESPYICIAPTSVWFTKQLPAEKWIELIEATRADMVIYLLGGKEDREACEAIREKSRHEQLVNLAGELNLLQSAALMKNAEMNYVNDSAPMHLASAMNAPCCAIFCSTVPEFGFGPLSDRSKIVQTHLNLDCRPCGLHGWKACPEEHFDCAWSINIRSEAIR